MRSKDKEPLFFVEKRLTNRGAERVTQELLKRVKSSIKMIPYISAMEVMESIIDEIPDKKDYKTYKKSFDIRSLAVKGKYNGYSITLNPNTRRVRKIDSSKTVLYVRSTKKLNKEKEKIAYLEDHGPWTQDTIPFWPKSTEATVIERIVSPELVKRINNEKTKPEYMAKVKKDLFKYGIKLNKKKKINNFKKKVVPDVANLAISLEFGEGDRKATPAWRKSLLSFKKIKIKTINRRHKALKNVFMPSSKLWKKFPKKTKQVKLSDIKVYNSFIRRLGY